MGMYSTTHSIVFIHIGMKSHYLVSQDSRSQVFAHTHTRAHTRVHIHAYILKVGTILYACMGAVYFNGLWEG